MSKGNAQREKRGTRNADLRHQLAIVAFGLFALVIVLMVLFPKLRPGEEEEMPSTVGGATRLLVLAASSLTDPLTRAAAAYEQAHPEWKLELSFAASNTLQRQIQNGAPADLFLSAAEGPAKSLVEDAWIMRDQLFVMWTTELVVIAPANAGRVETRGEAADAEGDPSADEATSAELDPAAALEGAQRIAIGDVGVPVGEYARQALDRLSLAEAVADRLVPLANEAAVVQAVATGACDRGLAYASSVRAGRQASRIRVLGSFSAGSHPEVTYYGGILASSPHADAVTAFLLYLTAGDGATILEQAGFRQPVAPVHPDS